MIINLIENFIQTVQTYGHKVAVIDGEQKIPFAELDVMARSAAKDIIDGVQQTCKPVAGFLPKAIQAVAADIAITYSGNAYMNLDIKTPSERLGNIIRLIQPVAIVTNHQYLSKIQSVLPENICIINWDNEQKNAPDVAYFTEHLKGIIDTDPYCIINTSGSTGTPKGVVLNHKSFIDFMEQTFGEYNVSSKDIIGSLSPIVFDIWSYELCMLMGKGATIVVIPDTYAAFPIKILQLMEQHHVTYIFWVPTIMVNIANMGLLDKVDLSDLRLCWFAGEVFPTKQFNIWYHALPSVTFANFYGPIEITLDCVYYTIDREIPDEEPIPIGKVFRNTDILILDEQNQRVTLPNIEGELCVRGTSLAMGYYNNPEKTAAAFVQNPLNQSYPEIIYRTGDIVMINDRGEMVFKGRKDSLIKHQGYRIELTEIEHVIVNVLHLVKNGCVVYNHAAKEISLFYESDSEISAADFRKAIGGKLPRYMIPMVYTHLDKLQRNTNGKIDRLYYNKLING